ncbi:MAG TPA: M42 family metallopeptidase [Anaerolineae bacterium]|nr:M42 family metallopeptidase [Anaerolineae bacterium]
MLLRELSEAFGVSGREDKVRELILRAIEDTADEYHVDALGNLIALKKGTRKAGPKVMLTAHMDEVGLMIMHIEKGGSLRFRPVGGIDPRVLLAKRVLIGDDRVPGVIAVKPIHLLEPKARQQVVRIQDMSIDIGASSNEAAERLVTIGDYAAFDTSFRELGGPLRAVKGKAFDDRAGCAVLIELLHNEYPFDLYAAFTTQEEVGLRGARVAAYSIAPDIAFALEGTVCDDTPKKRDVSPTTRVGAGPAITVMDRSVIADRRLVKLLTDTAEENGIPYQFKQPGKGGTDAGAIHLSREGVPSAVVAVPSRYIHSAVSLLSLNDLDNTVRLMKLALARVDKLDLDR